MKVGSNLSLMGVLPIRANFNGDLSHINDLIHAFVSQPENSRLRAGTGKFSTPFRGRLFGHEMIADINECLLHHAGIDVLCLGSNPNCPESVENIIQGTAGLGCFTDFEEQRSSGRLSESGWNPVQAPIGGWKIYADALDGPVNLTRVIMANAIPWGSSTTKDFLHPLSTLDPDLTVRLLNFSDGLVATMIAALRPRMIIVPRSLSEDKTIERQVPTYSLLKRNSLHRNARTLTVGRRKLHFYVGKHEQMGPQTSALYLPHPSSLRISAEFKPQIAMGLQREVVNLLHG